MTLQSFAGITWGLLHSLVSTPPSAFYLLMNGE
jgi:hypothetical protein